MHGVHIGCLAQPRATDREGRTSRQFSREFFPTVMFGVNHNAVVLLVDVWTRFCQAVPMRRKSGAAVAEAIAAFLRLLGYFEKVEIVCDKEPLLSRGVEHEKVIREKSKLETTSQCNKAFYKGRTAIAERTIQTVRNHSWNDSIPMFVWQAICWRSLWIWFYSLRAGWYCVEVQAKMGGRSLVDKGRSDQSVIATDSERIVRTGALRQIGEDFHVDLLQNLEASPEQLLKVGTHTDESSTCLSGVVRGRASI